MNVPPDFGSCPYCGSNDIISGSYQYSPLGTRQPSYKCKDCNHTFSYATYYNSKTCDVKVDTHLADLLLYGICKKLDEDKYAITPLGKSLIEERNRGGSSLSDRVLLNFPLWRELSDKLPLHPTKDMFFKALHEVMRTDAPSKTVQEWLWHRYNIEIVPVLERKSNRKGYGRGYIGITLIPNGVPL